MRPAPRTWEQRIMYNTLRNIVLSILRPYYVTAWDWSGAWGQHRAATLDDALSWAACYPCSAYVCVRTRSLRIVAQRSASLAR